jgi:hypothetical protein
MSSKNRCYGCKYFAGARGCIVQCDKGYTGVFLRDGCSDFTPDITASCGGGLAGCFYNQNGRTSSDINCSIHGFLKYSKEYCYDFAAREEDDCESKKKSGCFVTTAVCDILGKNDNCFELETLRKFRDEKLLPDENLKHLVFDYYEMSPKLVKKIMNSSKRYELAQYLLNEYINVIIKKIENQEKIEAINLYKQMVDEINKL